MNHFETVPHTIIVTTPYFNIKISMKMDVRIRPKVGHMVIKLENYLILFVSKLWVAEPKCENISLEVKISDLARY